MKAAEWIDRLKAEKGWESDYRVAKELKVGRATVSKYRNAGSTFDDETACRVADALQVEPELVIIDQVAERTKSERAGVALAGLLKRMAGKARAGGGAGAGRGPIDITSATSMQAGTDPEGVGYSSGRNTGIRIASIPNSGNSHNSPWRILAAAWQSMTSYGHHLAAA
jgi:transcriptional regulator with XRE-family HTH domain